MGLPNYFSFAKTEMWLPIALTDQQRANRGSHHLAVVARLKPGATLEQAQSQLAGIARHVEELNPEESKDWSTSVNLIHEQVVGASRKTILILLGAVAFVLLIACANVANLLLARSTSRQKEIAIRTALGAGRARIVRQLLLESVLLSLIGGLVGVILASWGIRLLLLFSPERLPRIAEIHVDNRVLWFTVAVSVLTGLLFGLVPALQASKTDLNESLKESGRSAMGGRHRQRARSLLVTSRSCTLTRVARWRWVAGQEFHATAKRRQPVSRRVIYRLPLSSFRGRNMKTTALKAQFFRQVVERVGGLPGVEAAAACLHLPLTGKEELDGFRIEGRADPVEVSLIQTADFRVITPDYFRAMRIPLLKGRFFQRTGPGDHNLFRDH